MNRNVESHFSDLPSVDIQRSIFDRSHTHKTSFNVGDLIPFYVDEVLPGDTFQVSTSKVIRLQTLLTPVMDNLYCDFAYYFVPTRLTWNHFKEFHGENNTSAWIDSTEYVIPTISAPASTGFATGTIADYMGLPVGVTWTNSSPIRPSALPFRAYALICDSYYRDENLTDPLNIPLGDSNQTGTNGGSYVNDVVNGGLPFKVAKFHDYFTSCLPSPQRGPSVGISHLSEDAPVYASEFPFGNDSLVWKSKYNHAIHDKNLTGLTGKHALFVSNTSGNMFAEETGSSTGTAHVFVPDNLYADLSNSAGITINELRLAFQLQKYYEKRARGGTRYTETLKMMFGVTSPDATLQRPQYLGGNRVRVQIHEVTNNSQGEQDFLGDLGAMSVTNDVSQDFTQSFTEHGYVIGVLCLRYDHSYSQGLEKFWTRKEVEQFYNPVFANIGEVPVYKSEIYATTTNMNTPSVFGYQEAWSDYRYKPDRISGEMRPGITNTLASWHFSDYYTQEPTLSDAWIREDKTNVDRTLAVTSTNANQAFADIYIQNICTRPMPMYSIPGLIDHH